MTEDEFREEVENVMGIAEKQMKAEGEVRPFAVVIEANKEINFVSMMDGLDKKFLQELARECKAVAIIWCSETWLSTKTLPISDPNRQEALFVYGEFKKLRTAARAIMTRSEGKVELGEWKSDIKTIAGSKTNILGMSEWN